MFAYYSSEQLSSYSIVTANATIPFKLKIQSPRDKKEHLDTFSVLYHYPEDDVFVPPERIEFTRNSYKAPDVAAQVSQFSFNLANFEGGETRKGSLSRRLHRQGMVTYPQAAESVNITWYAS
jgi:hypothetical protein